MDTVIITLTNKKNSFSFDLEIPMDVTVGKLKEDLYETITVYNPELYIRQPADFKLYCNRLGKCFDTDNTLRQEGIWNGDIITIMED